MRLETDIAHLSERVNGGAESRSVGSPSDALLQYRALADAQRRADQARAEVVDHLLQAMSASERADGFRRDALAVAETLLGQFLTPDNAASIIEDRTRIAGGSSDRSPEHERP